MNTVVAPPAPADAPADAPANPSADSPGALSTSERERYARHLSLAEIGEAGQARLRSARVLVIGAGGLGCPAALYLAAAGVGTIGLVDFDRVEASNLQRQVLFTSEDLGELKAQRACARLAALNPQVQLVAHAIELCAANVRETFAPYDLIVDGSDRIGTRYLVNDACVLYGKPLISAAIHRFEGQALSYVPGRGPCYRCLFPEIAEGTLPSCSQAGVLGVLPGVLGSLQATEAIKLLLGIGTPLIGRVLVYDALSMRFDEFRIARRPECAVCGDHPTIHAPQDPPGFCTIEEQRRVPRMLPAELAATLAREAGTLRLIDVREPDEFARGHLAGAINVPLPHIEQQGFEGALRSASVPRDARVPARQGASGRLVFICRSGARSLRACALARRGAGGEVLQLEGGLLAWREAVDPTLAL